MKCQKHPSQDYDKDHECPECINERFMKAIGLTNKHDIDFQDSVSAVGVQFTVNEINNEIKKMLYKTKPEAEFLKVHNGIVYYIAKIQTQNLIFDDFPVSEIQSGTFEYHFYFKIPVSDMGDTEFLKTMPAQLLIRWLDF